MSVFKKLDGWFGKLVIIGFIFSCIFTGLGVWKLVDLIMELINAL